MRRRLQATCSGALAGVLLVFAASLPATARQQPPDPALAGAPPLQALIERGRADSDLRVVLQRYQADRGALGRRYDIPLSPVAHARLREFHEGWLERLAGLDAATLNERGRADLDTLRARLADELEEIASAERRFEAMQPLLPFARPLQELQERRRQRLDFDAMESAQTLADALREVRALLAALEADRGVFAGITPAVAADAVAFLGAPPGRTPGGGAAPTLRGMLNNWYSYLAGYDPLFTWWARRPYEELLEALDAYRTAIERAWPAATAT
jgi:hypothetical protein